jgi:molybdopterin converting factor small subunit
MIITVKIFSYLNQYIPSSDKRVGGDQWNFAEGTTIAQTLTILNLPEEEPYIFLINNRYAGRERVLEEGDTLHIIPPVCGG